MVGIVIGKMILVGLRLLDQLGCEFPKTTRSAVNANLVSSIIFAPYKGKQSGLVLLRIHLSSSWLFHVFAAKPVWQVILLLSRYPVFLNHRTHGPHGKNPLTGMSCFRVFRGSLLFGDKSEFVLATIVPLCNASGEASQPANGIASGVSVASGSSRGIGFQPVLFFKTLVRRCKWLLSFFS
jgi:hypothetical protein